MIQLKDFQKRLWYCPEDVALELGSVTELGDNELLLHHNGKEIETDWAKLSSVDAMLPVTQSGTELIPTNSFQRGHYKIEAKVEEVNQGFHSAPLWFVSENYIMPEIDVVEVYYGKKMQSNLHFGLNYGTSTHFQKGGKNHLNWFNKVFRGWKFTDWFTYEMIWDRHVDIFYNGVRVRRFKDFDSTDRIIPIVSAKNGTIRVRNFEYNK